MLLISFIFNCLFCVLRGEAVGMSSTRISNAGSIASPAHDIASRQVGDNIASPAHDIASRQVGDDPDVIFVIQIAATQEEDMDLIRQFVHKSVTNLSNIGSTRDHSRISVILYNNQVTEVIDFDNCCQNGRITLLPLIDQQLNYEKISKGEMTKNSDYLSLDPDTIDARSAIQLAKLNYLDRRQAQTKPILLILLANMRSPYSHIYHNIYKEMKDCKNMGVWVIVIFVDPNTNENEANDEAEVEAQYLASREKDGFRINDYSSLLSSSVRNAITKRFSSPSKWFGEADISTTCNGTTKGSTLWSPGFMAHHQYDPNVECVWVIQAKSGFRVSLKFLQFITEEVSDVVKIFDGRTMNMTSHMATYTGDLTDTLPTVTSTNEQITVTFQSDDSFNQIGFQLKWRTIPQEILIKGMDVVFMIDVSSSTSEEELLQVKKWIHMATKLFQVDEKYTEDDKKRPLHRDEHFFNNKKKNFMKYFKHVIILFTDASSMDDVITPTSQLCDDSVHIIVIGTGYVDARGRARLLRSCGIYYDIDVPAPEVLTHLIQLGNKADNDDDGIPQFPQLPMKSNNFGEKVGPHPPPLQKNITIDTENTGEYPVVIKSVEANAVHAEPRKFNFVLLISLLGLAAIAQLCILLGLCCFYYNERKEKLLRFRKYQENKQANKKDDKSSVCSQDSYKSTQFSEDPSHYKRTISSIRNFK